MAARSRKTPVEIPVPATMPGRNGGTLRRGGYNHGAGGRTPSELREKMRGALVERIQIAQSIADNAKSSDSDRLRALDFLAKYGLGTTVTETDTDGHDVNPPGRLTPEQRKETIARLLTESRN